MLIPPAGMANAPGVAAAELAGHSGLVVSAVVVGPADVAAAWACLVDDEAGAVALGAVRVDVVAAVWAWLDVSLAGRSDRRVVHRPHLPLHAEYALCFRQVVASSSAARSTSRAGRISGLGG